jgi:hypothetical protein
MGVPRPVATARHRCQDELISPAWSMPSIPARSHTPTPPLLATLSLFELSGSAGSGREREYRLNRGGDWKWTWLTPSFSAYLRGSPTGLERALRDLRYGGPDFVFAMLVSDKLTPARVHRGFRHIHPRTAHPAGGNAWPQQRARQGSPPTSQ